MKKINSLFIFFSLAFFLVSCNDFLDKMPDNRAEVNSSTKITSLLTSAYSTSSYALMTELSSDNAKDNGAEYTVYNDEQTNSYLWKDITTTGNDAPKAVWDANYGAIAAANQALQAIEKLGNPSSLKAQKGEALICRAYAHFTLANVFCLTYNPTTADTDLGLPYSESPETQVSVPYKRGSMAELYTRISADIDSGLPLINDEIYSVPKYHFNKKAAYAFASRFNLYYQKFDKVIKYANVVLGNSQNVFRDWASNNASASDWTLRTNAYISASSPANLLIQTAISSWPYVYGPYNLGKRYGNAKSVFSSESVRVPGIWGAYSNLYPAGSVWGSDQKLCISKMQGYFEYSDKVAGVGYIHSVITSFTTDETLLCRAEAYVLQAVPDYAKAVADINTWLSTHCASITPKTKDDIVNFYNGLPYMSLQISSDAERKVKKELHPRGFTVTAGDQENMIQCILHLRRIETMHEGLRWFDVKRYGIEIVHNRDGLTPDLLRVDDPRRAIQLPQDVINAGLAANPR